MKEQLKELEQELQELFNEKAYSRCLNGIQNKDYVIKSDNVVAVDNKFLNNDKSEGMSYVRLSFDRGRNFALPNISKEVFKQFFELKVIPDIDAFRFAKLAKVSTNDLPLNKGDLRRFTARNFDCSKPSIKVPQIRFYSSIDIYDGISLFNNRDGGYGKSDNSKPIKLLEVDKNSVCGIVNISLTELEPIKQYPCFVSLRVAYDLFISDSSKIYVEV